MRCSMMRMVMPRSAIARINFSAWSTSPLLRPAFTSSRSSTLRLHRQALRELEPLAAGERQRRRRPVRFIGETDKREMVECRSFGLCPTCCLTGEQRACGDVLQDRHLRKRLNNLERARQPIPRGLPWPSVA